MFAAITKAFDKIHKDCKPTWKEPTANPTTTITERANWWITNGETGTSSKSIWAVMMGTNPPHVDHPYDPDDFKRCYKLLAAIPEWRPRLHEMGKHSTAWKNLAANWDKLTEMFEQNTREQWKNYKKVGMYEFMQTLIK